MSASRRSLLAVVLQVVGALALAPSVARATDADRLDLPDGVRFTPAPAAVNDAARKKLEAAFAAPDGKVFSSLFAGVPVICGPGLWQWVKQAPRAMKVGTLSPFLVPLGGTADPANSQSLEGRTYFDKAAAHTFLGFLRAGLPLAPKPVVRRPTRLEIALLWSMIPFDLEDPLFVVEIGGHNLIVVLSSKNRTVLWIDDLAGAAFEPGKGITLPSAPRYVARS